MGRRIVSQDLLEGEPLVFLGAFPGSIDPQLNIGQAAMAKMVFFSRACFDNLVDVDIPTLHRHLHQIGSKAAGRDAR